MKKLLTVLFLYVATCAMHAQEVEPVQWTSEIEQLSDTEFNLIYKATIDSKWRLYSQYLEENSGFPTEFMYDSIQQINDFKLVGKSQESKGITKFDKTFKAEMTYFKGTATFTQKIEVLNPELKTITSEVIYQTCDDEKCVLGDKEFTFEIPQKEGKISVVVKESNVLEPVTWRTSVKKLTDIEYEISFKAAIDKGWHLYSQKSYGDLGPFPTEINFENAGETYELVGKMQESPTKDVYDNIFQMDISYYEKEATFTQKIKLNDPNTKLINAEIVYMVCDDEKCLPPTGVDLTIALDNSTEIISTLTDELTPKDVALSNELDLGITGQEKFKDDSEISEKSNLMVFFLGFLGGLIALLTPCVFPMIPLTVSFFTKSGANSQKGLFNSMLYGFFIFLIYFLLSLPFHVLDSLDPEILNNVSTNATLNIIFFVVFVVFAFSFFGYFELTLPASWSNSLDSKANSIGGAIGIFLMALVLVIVSFSCTGPILGALLGSTTLAAGDPAMKLTMGMSGFGLALALPFTLFAMFPKWLNSLPRSGGWLNSVKVVLGFIELALALKFLSNADLVSHWGILKREIFIGIWVILGIGLALYVFGKLKFPHDSPIKKLSFGRITFGILVIAFVIYLIPGLTNTKHANLKLLSGFPPPLFYSLYDQQAGVENTEHGDCPLGLPCYKNLDEGIAAAKEENKPIMLDFTGWACVNCRKMEEQVWSQKSVFNILNEEYILISLYVDDRKPLPEDQKFKFDKGNGNIKKIKTYGDKLSTLQTLNFNNNSQPYYVLLSPDMEMLQKPVGYTPDAQEYTDWLQKGLENFKNNN